MALSRRLHCANGEGAERAYADGLDRRGNSKACLARHLRAFLGI